MKDVNALEERLSEYGRSFTFPPTPAIHRAVRARLARPRPARLRPALRWAMVGLVVLLAAALAVPQVRAQVIEFLRFGAVRIFPAPPAPIPTQPVLVPVTATPWTIKTPQLEPEHSISFQGLAGESSLASARNLFGYPILLPAYPPDLGEPDRVFIQEDGRMIILVWLDESGSEALLSLHQIAPDSVIYEKFEPRLIEETLVNGEPAAWVSGPYLLQVTSGDIQWRKIVDGDTLIWESGGVTYRIESAYSLEETVHIAESLR